MYGDPIKIVENTIYPNKTKKYLAPILRYYGNTFATYYIQLNKVAFGINDMVAIKSNHIIEKAIFILFKVSPEFSPFLKWIRTQEYCIYDYVYDIVHYGKYHMIIISYPELYSKSYLKFLEGKYSEMFEKKELELFFRNDTTIKILTKDKDYKEEFKKQLQKEFNYFDYIPDNYCDELDIKFSEKQEIFNYKLK